CQHVPARPGAPRLEKRDVPRRDIGLVRQRELTQVACLAPVLEECANGCGHGAQYTPVGQRTTITSEGIAKPLSRPDSLARAALAAPGSLTHPEPTCTSIAFTTLSRPPNNRDRPSSNCVTPSGRSPIWPRRWRNRRRCCAVSWRHSATFTEERSARRNA